MMPEQEKKLQRILQGMTIFVALLAVGLWITVSDFHPFASLFQSEVATPNILPEVPKKGVPRGIAQIAPEEQKPTSFSSKPTDDNSPTAIEARGDEAFAARDFQKAETQYELVRAVADTPLLRLKYVRSLLAQRKILEAQTFLDAQKDDQSTGLKLYRGVLSALLNKPEESAKLLQEVADTKTEDATEQIFVEKAQTILRAYNEWKFTTDGKTEHLQAMLAKSFDEIGEFGIAIEMALDAIKTRDDYRDAWVVLGHAYLAYQKYQDAASALQKALTLDASHPQSYFYLSFAKRGLGKWQESLDALEKSAEIGMPKNAFFEEQEAVLFYELGKYESALPLYLKTLSAKAGKAQPEEYIRPLYLLLEVFNKKSDGLALAQKAFSYAPKNPMSYNLVGWAYLSSGNLAEAGKNLKEALRLDPTLAAAEYNIARLAELEQKPEEAQQHYEKALSLALQKGDESIAGAARKRLEKFAPSAVSTPS